MRPSFGCGGRSPLAWPIGSTNLEKSVDPIQGTVSVAQIELQSYSRNLSQAGRVFQMLLDSGDRLNIWLLFFCAKLKFCLVQLKILQCSLVGRYSFICFCFDDAGKVRALCSRQIAAASVRFVLVDKIMAIEN
jgi:hypothetical protein